MHKSFLRAAAIFGLLAVVSGAFAAHALKGMISDNSIATFETAVRYQFYHVFALIAVAVLYKDFQTDQLIWAGRFFIAGILVFSGSLYILAILQASVKPGYKWIGAITPFGGLCFITGWVLLFLSFFRKN